MILAAKMLRETVVAYNQLLPSYFPPEQDYR